MNKINPYGMKTGIVKVIPPPEWKAGLPRLDEAIKTVRVKEPIKQDIMGTGGTYRQANILHQRSYNLPQWRQLCEQSEHQPPAKRGERRANQDKAPAPRPVRAKGTSTPTSASAKRKGRSTKNKLKAAALEAEDGTSTPDRLPTPDSPSVKAGDDMESVKQEVDDEDETPSRPKGGRQPKSISVSSRRKYNRREAAAKVDEEAFKDFKYELDGNDYSKERCEELERAYWKTLTYAPPLYGADMPGTLFDDRTTTWNLGRLENLLDVLGTKIPGVNTAYLYLGMWKATFAWHLEDVDLYSINYLHFGAPKQWYSISQGDARRFEAAMKSIWPTDAKACDQFLRHKTFLISPSHLLQNFNIKVNKIVHNPGEFVITFPYGYHSGYNLGYNCAEAVNFALDSWMEYGRVAKKCDCSQAQDSVWIDIREIERKLRGEETDYDETDEEEEDEDEDETGPTDLPTPPESSGDIKPKAPKRKRKRPFNDKGGDNVNVKRIRVRIKAPSREPCILCPNDIPSEPLLPTEDGQKAHRLCGVYIPETSIDSGEAEKVVDVKYIDKARLDLKCNYCRSKKGACFQCSQKKCTRAYHATCAAAAGVLVEQGEIPVFGEDGTEYKEWGIEFSCRFHRSKRDKKLDSDALSDNDRIRKAASALKVGQTCQMQFYRGDIFAGAVVENRKSEEMLLLDILPRGYVKHCATFSLSMLTNNSISERVEVEYKWLLIPDPADFRLAKPSANAIPMPKSRLAKESLNTTKRLADDAPRADDIFGEGFTWSEFKCENIARNTSQVKVDFKKENQIWFYLGKTSTEAKAQFTEDLAKARHNPKGHFLDTIPKPVVATPRHSYGASYPSTNVNQNALNASRAASASRPSQPAALISTSTKPEKPYVYKPRNTGETYRVDQQAYLSQQSFLQRSAPYNFGTDPRWGSSQSPTTPYPNHSSASIPQTQRLAQPQLSQHASQPQVAQQVQQPQISQPVQPQRPPPSQSPLAPPPAYYRHPYTPPSYIPAMQPPKQNNPFSGRSQSTRPNPFAKYAYLQKEHNRSPLEYKSPYRPGFGFMNGYQGNLEKHLQQNLFKERSDSSGSLSNPLLTYGSNSRMYTPSQSYSSTPPSSSGSYGTTKQHTPSTLPPVPKPTTPSTWEKKDTSQLHPAIRQEYNSMLHSQYQPPPPPAYQIQLPHQSPLAPPPAYYQQPYPLQAFPENGVSPQNSSFPQTSQLYQQPSNSPPYQPQYQTHPQPQYQENKPLYAHQQYFQKPHSQVPMTLAPQSQPQAHAHAYADFPDVPADSSSLIERMMMNLRKATSSSSAP
jgi:hypothetical protein